MEDCCSVDASAAQGEGCAAVGNRPEVTEPLRDAAHLGITCPACHAAGKPVERLTIKSLLHASALATLDVSQSFRFCASSDCPIVYYGDRGQAYQTQDLRVKVYQKDASADVPVCYCFAWTRARLAEELLQTGQSTAATVIAAHIGAGRCACEVNNPQGACCLGNVGKAVKEAREGKSYVGREA